jgi:P27 family predicted phage terminase small subunit
MKTDNPPRPPTHLSPSARRFWSGIVRDFALDSHHLRTLEAACQAWDRYQQAREILSKSGLTFTDRLGNVRARPECKVETDSRTSYLRAMRELGLDHVGAPEAPRPNALT